MTLFRIGTRLIFYSALGGADSVKQGRSLKTENIIRHASDGKLPLCIYKELVLILGLSPNPYEKSNKLIGA